MSKAYIYQRYVIFTICIDVETDTCVDHTPYLGL